MTRILIVDDEENAREVIRESVSILGYQVEEASDGLDALERFRDRHHDVVITDMSMPRMDGIELTRELHKVDPLVPVLMLTGRDSLDLKAMAWSRGIVDYLSKPFRLSSLEATLERVVQSRGLELPGTTGFQASAMPIRKFSDLVPYLLVGGALMGLFLLWLFWDHLLDVRSLSHLVDGK
jgi:DNA-binding response OmpR family regulator